MKSEIELTADFIRSVHELVASIPSGKVVTYGQIAAMVGQPEAAREVGLVMSRVPAEKNLPCHRVVSKTGALAPDYAFNGQERQRALLEKEGIQFDSDGCIIMSRCQWNKREEQLSLF